MRIHRIRGRDLREALEKAGRMHGPQSLVLGHENVSGGVTVAVADARRSQIVARPRVEQSAGVRRAPGLGDVERVLRRTGASDALIDELLAEVEKSAERGAYALDEAARLLGQRVAVAPSPKIGGAAGAGRRPCALAFCGPPGSGKTTTVAKLAARLAQKRRRAALVTFDAQARKRLAEYGQLLQAPVDTARGAENLRRLIERSRSFDVVLIDATGDSARDVALLRELRVRDPEVRLETYLLAPATDDRSALEEAALLHGDLPLSGLVITHVDETCQVSPALEHSMTRRLPVAFLCDGPELGGHLRRPRPDDFADLFLRGRLS